MKKIKIPLLAKIVIAIAFGIVCSLFFPLWTTRIFKTFNSLFNSFLGFFIPLLIIGLIAPGIAELGKGAGRLLGVTALIAYGSTILSGFFSYFTCKLTYPSILVKDPDFLQIGTTIANDIEPYFTINIPPILDVMSALVLSFILGLGLAVIQQNTFRNVLSEFREVILMLISKVIIPCLPIYIFTIFLEIGAEGQISSVLALFFKVILIIFAMHILLLLIQFCIAGTITRKNPIKTLLTMLPAYFTALGTQSSAATIPVTLAQAKKNGVNPEIADFVIPLCATIHLSGSTLKIVACAYAISWMMGMQIGLDVYAGFIMMLGVTMVAAPGVPGGAIMAALGVIATMLGFDANLQGLMIALYIAMDSFGTACNVTGDGAIAMVVSKLYGKNKSNI